MGEKNIFILSKEAYMVDMFINRFELSEDNITFDPENIPEHQEFADFYFDILLDNKNVIDFDDDTVFIVKYDYNLAKSFFGEAVCDAEATKMILAEILMERYDVNCLEYYDLVEFIEINKDISNKKDIENWFKDQKELTNDIKNSTAENS